MFMIFSIDKIKTYLVSLGTVMMLFVMCFFITNSDAKILQTSGNTYQINKISNDINQINNINNK